MIHTRICDLLGVAHPIVLGGMGSATTAPLVAAVSNAGGFGTLGTSAFNAATLENEIAAIHERTDKPFGVNHLLFQIRDDMFAVTLRARPKVAAFAWARKEQNLNEYFQRAHDAGCKVMHAAVEVLEIEPLFHRQSPKSCPATGGRSLSLRKPTFRPPLRPRSAPGRQLRGR